MNEVKKTYVLAIKSIDRFRPKSDPPAELVVQRAEIPSPELNWFMHQAVGAAYRWGGREQWSRQDWMDFVSNPIVETWVATIRGTPAGFYEMKRHPDNTAQIVCFGLIGQFIGQGYGGHFLTAAVQRGWEEKPDKVWLTTCSHDHPNALKNYLARGFEIVDDFIGEPNPTRSSSLFQ